MKKTFFLIYGCLLFSCGEMDLPTIDNPIESIIDEPAIEDQGTAEDLQQAMLDFGFKSFLEINKDTPQDENIIISPLSIETALFMTSNGATDETLDEMRMTLELGNLYPSGTNQYYKEIIEQIQSDATNETFLNTAQAVYWDQTRMNVFEDFQQNMQEFYDADLVSDNFTVDAINAWAKEKTEGRIPEILEQLGEDEVMFLLNALYFIGDWELPFEENLTGNWPFNLSNGSTIDVPTMRNDFSFFNYEDETLKAVDLFFKGSSFSMTFIQPTESINDYLNQYSFNELSTNYKSIVNDQMQENRILLSLPKFEIKYKKVISQELKSLGMERAFQEANAQLGKLGQAGGNLFISRVIHDTFLKIDEKGAEGAAVTAVGVGVESVPPPFIFDKPFMIVLRHVDTDVPIFIGKIMDPSL
jgi:serpin B